jgi:hypothetical protein
MQGLEEPPQENDGLRNACFKVVVPETLQKKSFSTSASSPDLSLYSSKPIRNRFESSWEIRSG